MPYQVRHNLVYIGPANSYEEAIDRLLNHKGRVAVDTETIGLKGDKSVAMTEYDEDGEAYETKLPMDARTCIGIGVAISPTEAYYFPNQIDPAWVNVPKCDLHPLYMVLENEEIEKNFFNSMFDLDRIEETTGIRVNNFQDVAIACQVQGLWNSLDRNCGEVLGIDHKSIDEVLPKGKTMLDLKFNVTSWKCMHDCMDTLKLAELFKLSEWESCIPLAWRDYLGREHAVSADVQDCYNVDRHLVPVLRKMSRRGIKIRPDVVEKWNYKLLGELRYYDDWFKDRGINVASNDQVAWLLSKRGHWLPFTDSKKHMRVDEEVLLSLHDPVAHMILSRRRRAKLQNTYIKPMLDKDTVYTNFRLDLATGRLGSFDFNSQNFPPSMRGIFEGPWSWMDLHQAEMRVWANQAQDPVMLGAFEEGSSPHITTLHTLFPGVAKSNPDGSSTREYVDSKSFNFAFLAQASVKTLARTTKRPLVLVQKLQDEMHKVYWKSVEHMNYMRVRHVPWSMADYVQSDFGRMCHIPDGLDVTYEHQEKCRLNWPFQASVADLVKRIMIAYDALGMDMVFQVHDEIVVAGKDVEFPAWTADMHPKIPMPFEVSRGESWI